MREASSIWSDLENERDWRTRRPGRCLRVQFSRSTWLVSPPATQTFDAQQRFIVGPPEVGAKSAFEALFRSERQAVLQLAGALFTAVTKDPSQSAPSAALQGDPYPPGLLFLAHEGPQLIQFDGDLFWSSDADRWGLRHCSGPFFIHRMTVLRWTPKTRCTPLRLIRS